MSRQNNNQYSTLDCNLTLNKQTVILNLPGFHSILLENDKYVKNIKYFMTDLQLVSSSLNTLLKKVLYFITL